MAIETAVGAVDTRSIQQHSGLILERQVYFRNEIIGIFADTVLIHVEMRDAKNEQIIKQNQFALKAGDSFNAEGVWEKFLHIE